MGTASHPQGCLEWRRGHSKFWKGASGVGGAPGEIFRPRAAKQKAEHLLKTNVSTAFSSKLYLHKEIILTALLPNWQGAPAHANRNHC